MTVQYLPSRPLPPGHRYFSDVVREIEERENLTATGFHFAFEPGADRIEEIARVHELCDPALLTARHIDTGNKARPNDWTLFRRNA